MRKKIMQIKVFCQHLLTKMIKSGALIKSEEVNCLNWLDDQANIPNSFYLYIQQSSLIKLLCSCKK